MPKTHGFTQAEVLSKFKEKFNDFYGYDNFVYKTMKTKSLVTCKIHGDWLVSPANLLKGNRCPHCGFQSMKQKRLMTQEQFIQLASKKHNNFYDYSKVSYVHSQQKVIIICNKHGEFSQRPSSHLDGTGCPICKSSKGERTIIQYLIDNDIPFVPQKKFVNCINIKSKRKLPFDFFLPTYNLCIEYQGRQHFIQIDHWGHHKLEISQYRDSIKKNYCAENGIGYLSIPYTEDAIQVLASTLGIDTQSSECSTHCQCNSTVESH
jgi:hypothetical protein